jgi:hypothetical protein
MGFRARGSSGTIKRQSANGRCWFVYAWEITTVRLWYSAFLVECLDFTLYYISVCKMTPPPPTATPPIGVIPTPPTGPLETIPAPAGGAAAETGAGGAPAAGGTGTSGTGAGTGTTGTGTGTTGAGTGTTGTGTGAAAGGTAVTPAAAEEWVTTTELKETETSCSFGSVDEVTHTDRQNLFNTLMGIYLPPAHTPEPPATTPTGH